jgi:FtsP/CotA-like multicopper oxidase with cupredoxin domain
MSFCVKPQPTNGEPLSFTTPFPLPPLLDMTKNEIGYVTFELNKDFKPAPDCAPSGMDVSLPILATHYHLGTNGPEHYKSFGMPFFKFKRGVPVEIKFTNYTGYSFDLHWHGLNTPADDDGATEVLEFGVDTYFSPKFDLTFPAITNNSTLLWVHAHNMFISAPLMYGGAYGTVLIVDDESKHITDQFVYSDNHLIFALQDLQFNADGSLTNVDIYTDEHRTPFTMINGVSCVNWYKDGKAPYTTQMYHKSTKNLVKIDMVASTNSFRYYYFGVCDKNDNIKSFYLVQTGAGFRNPLKLTMIGLAPAQRFAFIVDLNDFDGGEAYVFMYNFDLTEVYGLDVNAAGQLEAPIPDLTKTTNPTPYPTPIPDPATCNGQTYTNQQGDMTNLTYPPICPPIPQTTMVVPYGNIPAPQQTGKPFTIKKFLKLNWKKKCQKHPTSIKKIVKEIRKLIFGEKNYCMFKNLIKQPNFEYNNNYGINYISLLNPDYFYNIPDLTKPVPLRNFVLMGDDCENYRVPCSVSDICSLCLGLPNPLGGTEFVNGQNRVWFDLWNSEELDLGYAMTQYQLSPNNFKPDVLPTCLFKISQTNTQYYNLSMASNDTLNIDFYDHPIAYADLISSTPPAPIARATIVYPPTNPNPPEEIKKPLNIKQWVNLANRMFDQTTVTINGSTVPLSSMLSLDWTFYPFRVNHLKNSTVYLKNVLMINRNKSPYYINYWGSLALLQFFGKSIGAMPAPPATTCTNMFPNNLDFYVTFMYAQYATEDPTSPIAICPGANVNMIIKPHQTFYGFIDAFENDNLMSFSVKLDSTEYWVYHNMDTEDSHPLHFHLTSGFVDPRDPINTQAIVSNQTLYYPHTYSIDVYGVPPQQTLAWYLRFATYSSEDTGLYKQPQQQKYLGYMYHCHFMEHHDMNMMSQYFVYPNRDEYFSTSE